MFKRNLLGFTIVLAIIIYALISIVTLYNTYACDDKRVTFNYNGQEFKTGHMLYMGRMYVPLRTISDKFGYNIKWEAKHRTITISNNKDSIQFQFDSKIILLNNKTTITMDVEPLIIDDMTFVPIRFAIEPLGKFVGYYEDDSNRVISITDVKSVQDVSIRK